MEFNAKDIHKEMFPVYGGKCLPRKWFTNESRNVANVSLMTDVETEMRKWLRQQSKTSTLRF
jgi:hypothetical protein